MHGGKTGLRRAQGFGVVIRGAVQQQQWNGRKRGNEAFRTIVMR